MPHLRVCFSAVYKFIINYEHQLNNVYDDFVKQISVVQMGCVIYSFLLILGLAYHRLLALILLTRYLTICCPYFIVVLRYSAFLYLLIKLDDFLSNIHQFFVQTCVHVWPKNWQSVKSFGKCLYRQPQLCCVLLPKHGMKDTVDFLTLKTPIQLADLVPLKHFLIPWHWWREDTNLMSKFKFNFHRFMTVCFNFQCITQPDPTPFTLL